ncbi:electron transfer flavoprotein subunit beta, partial [candidate division WOR-3 bacterium]|nr:electron transfer flavoprotein subunit beta [candidate division WOR-3 bacterium]
MDIAVCIKRVPETAEAAVNIDSSEKRIVEDQLVFDINEADNYALEEALLLREKEEGEITLFTVGPEKSDEVMKMGLAKGATRGV